jgi:hypothetical protein
MRNDSRSWISILKISMKHPANKSPGFSGAPGAADFLEDLIDACVMESGESMKSKGSGINS